MDKDGFTPEETEDEARKRPLKKLDLARSKDRKVYSPAFVLFY
jgi:hypothetical protein